MPLSDTLSFAMRLHEPSTYTDERSPEQALELDRFLGGVEKRAFRIARIVLRHDDDALDVVQDAMLQLARRYGARPSEEWRPLFYRILQNRIRDVQRRRKVRGRVMSWFGGRAAAEEETGDWLDAIPDTGALPLERLSLEESMAALECALRALPLRQREAFVLRNFEGMNVAETARAMGCTEGSVKTHYSRAVHTLREQLDRGEQR